VKLLVLGGTRFLGRHFVEAARSRGHAVSVFTRGRAPLPWAGVDARTGNRDPRIEPGLSALAHGTWDAVLDTSGYVPRVVKAGVDRLHAQVGRYLFVSSLSVYADAGHPGIDEGGALARLDDPSTEDVLPHYGALKTACEAVVLDRFAARATIVRPGLIVGPHDATDRFGYWVARFCAPRLLGERGRDAAVPGPPARPIQLVDARDLAAWMLALIERDEGGTYNACSPAGQWTFGDLVAALVAAAPETGPEAAPRPCWVTDATLAAHGVAPWVGLPLWIPASDAESAGFMSFDCRRAQASGLAVRPLAATVADTAAWLRARDNAGAWQHVLDGAREAAIVQDA
jgi:2'-hydroxyisoflavone reductase